SFPSFTATGRARVDVARYLFQLPLAVAGERLGDSLFRVDWGFWKSCVRPHLTTFADLELKPSRLLDLGCGDGLVTCFYAPSHPAAEVVAVDQCKLCLLTTKTIAKRLMLRNLRVVEGDAAELSSILPGQRFDAVVARSLVGHRMASNIAHSDVGNDDVTST